jgi:hypothetical protein
MLEKEPGMDQTAGINTDDIERLRKLWHVGWTHLHVECPPDEYWCDVTNFTELTMGVKPANRMQATWSITITRPNQWGNHKMPAQFRYHGTITPLSVKIINALMPLMWTDLV